MKVAAWQAPLESCTRTDVLQRIAEQVQRCEELGVAMLCCPEGILGGLADYAERPGETAINVEGGELPRVLAPLESNRVTTIVGFTEVDHAGRLFNSAAVWSCGAVSGVYRKRHPAINRSVYRAGNDSPVFTVGPLTFGIMICRDSTFPELARELVSQRASVLFVPSNNGLPIDRDMRKLAGHTRNADRKMAGELAVSVIRADVAGSAHGLMSQGSSGIVHHDGTVLALATAMQSELIVADIDVLQPTSRRS